jgi:predicted secreted protein
MTLFPWFLFAHILGAIIAFGASFSTFPLLGAMSGQEPAHANFGSRVSHAISTKVVRPLAILQGITGVALIWLASIDLTKALWLDVAIVIYVIAIGYALFVQIPVGHRLVELTSGGPPPAAADGAPAAPKGPPPELIATAMKARRGGIFLGVAIAFIVFLMVVKPF